MPARIITKLFIDWPYQENNDSSIPLKEGLDPNFDDDLESD
jgi:hypothetical protein